MNPFSKILSTGLSAFSSGNKGESVVGIDIGSSAIKVVQLRRKGAKAILETYGALALGPYAGVEVGHTTNLPPDKLSLALTDVLREASITTKECAISIPAASSLVFLINLPSSISEKELPNVIATEARKYIPVPITEVSLDWWIIPKKEESFEESPTEGAMVAKREILIAAIHNETIQKYRDIVKSTALDASFFEIELFSSIRSSFNHELSTVLIIDMGAMKTKLSIIEYGIVHKFHTINRGSQDISSALATSLNVTFLQGEQTKREFGLLGNPADPSVAQVVKLSIDYILSETASVILNYEREQNKTISKVILTGGGVLLKGFLPAAQEAFKSEVILAKPFDKVEAPAFLDKVLESAGPEFAVAAGLALRQLEQNS
ncbi:type IV pilus assembly protein PilM [Candidatus Nomurabacteria bacterium]|jgi:type IV pilus assembly protein PilM|nr:MAG: type IV pilus assembly protein PilM [Candidatus Nomurabacteria bacterium]